MFNFRAIFVLLILRAVLLPIALVGVSIARSDLFGFHPLSHYEGGR